MYARTHSRASHQRLRLVRGGKRGKRFVGTRRTWTEPARKRQHVGPHLHALQARIAAAGGGR